MRLAFHDCLTYNNVQNGEINGCDGCLNPTGMNEDLFEKYGEHQRNAPNNLTFFTNNNGLTATADVLEEIFTNPNFPRHKSIPKSDTSMKDSGKSRADLWAFAAMVAVKFGIDNNNKACKGQKA